MSSYLHSIRHETSIGILWIVSLVLCTLFFPPLLFLVFVAGGLFTILALVHLRNDYVGSAPFSISLLLLFLLMPIIVLYGAFNSWMNRIGFGRVFRGAVLVAISLLVIGSLPLHYNQTLWLLLAGIMSSLIAVLVKGLWYSLPWIICAAVWILLP